MSKLSLRAQFLGPHFLALCFSSIRSPRDTQPLLIPVPAKWMPLAQFLSSPDSPQNLSCAGGRLLSHMSATWWRTCLRSVSWIVHWNDSIQNVGAYQTWKIYSEDWGQPEMSVCVTTQILSYFFSY